MKKIQLINVHTHTKSSNNLDVFQLDLRNPKIPDFFFSVGLHPIYLLPSPDELISQINELLTVTNCIAIGESGLDKYSSISTEEQMRLFRAQMILSEQHQLPIIIHCVGRWNELEHLFKEKQVNTPAWVIHGFRKTRLINKFLELGAYLSFGEALLYDELLQEAVKTVPLDRLFLETDTAAIDINLLYEKLAEIKSVSLQAVIDQLFETYLVVFQHGKLA